MTLYRLPAGAVLLDGEALRLVAYCVATAERTRRRNGLPPLPGLVRLREALTAPGHPDADPEPVGDAESVTTAEAARLLGCSERTIRRQAARLGGRNVGGRWLLDRAAVEEHRAGSEPREGVQWQLSMT